MIAERNGRPVLAVKAGAAAQLQGLVHDSSASGSTVFIEPQAVIPLGNRIRQLEGQEREAEQAVLASMLVDRDAMARVSHTLAAGSFYRSYDQADDEWSGDKSAPAQVSAASGSASTRRPTVFAERM